MFKKKDNKGTNPLFIGLGVFLGLIFGIALGSPFLGLILGLFIAWRLSNKASIQTKKENKPFEDITDVFKKKSKPHKTPHKTFDINKAKYPKFTIGTAVFILVILGLLWFFRPWFHDFLMSFYRNPLVIGIIIFAALAGVAFTNKQSTIGAIFIALAVLSFIALSFTEVFIGLYVVNGVEYNKITELPDSNKIRILPRVVAARYMEDSLQKSREKLGPLDFVYINNSPVWTSPRIPDGFILYLTEPVKGIMTADGLSSDRKTKLTTMDLKVGEGIGITDNIYWQIFKQEYFMDVGDIYYVNEDGGIITVVPVIRYKFKFPVMVPYYAGVFIVHEDGKIERKAPEEVEKIPYLKGNRPFPESLARLYIDSYKYHKGVINTWFLHEDQIEISDVYGQGNRQPFILPTEEGLKWIAAVEPYGESYGVFKIFFVDALTGKLELLELNEDQTLTGPVKVVSYVKKKFPRIDWATATVIEPRPVINNNVLYWMLSITPRDFAGISYTVFVNSENNEVTALEKDKDVFAFVKGKEVQGVSEAEGEIKITPEEESAKEGITYKEEQISEKIALIEKSLDELKALVAE